MKSKEKRFPSPLMAELDKHHAVYHLDLFTDEPIVEKPTPAVVSLLRNFISENSEVINYGK